MRDVQVKHNLTITTSSTWATNYDGVTFQHIPQEGWPRVRVALGERLPHDEANAVAQDWEASRFTASEVLRFIREDVIRHQDVEEWQRVTGRDRPAVA